MVEKLIKQYECSFKLDNFSIDHFIMSQILEEADLYIALLRRYNLP